MLLNDPELYEQEQTANTLKKNLIGLLSLFAKEIIQSDELTATISHVPHPAWNSVFLNNDTCGNQLAALIQQYHSLNLPYCLWLTNKQIDNVNFITLMRQYNLVQGDFYAGLHLNLVDFKIDNTIQHQITEIKDKSQLEEWNIPFKEAFELNDLQGEIILKEIQRLFTNPNLKHFIATKDKKVVGCASYYIHDGHPTFYNCGVFKEYQKQGIGTSLKRFRLNHLKERGYKTVSIHSIRDKIALDKSLGFKECDRYQAFLGNME